jgi:hypothetical protein
MFLVIPAGLEAQSDSTAKVRTTTVIASEQYGRPPGGQTFFLGKDYRDLWTTPIEVEVLDLQSFAGGLKPVMRIGGNQTLGLALKGRDGRDYSFRSVDKDYSDQVVPPAFQGTIIEEIIQDQIAANFPGVQVVTAPIESAAGLLVPLDPRLVVMPDDPALGEFQEAFAGVLGVFTEFGQPASSTNPGFHGATEIIGHEDFWVRRQAGSQDLPDTHAFLRARLVDILLNDWDRHRRQWRWARIPGEQFLQPIPEDRDQVFADFEGMALKLGRMQGGQMVTFEEDFDPFYRATQNGWDVDRFLLTNIEKSDWMRVASDVQTRLTDEVLDEGLQRMPKEYYMLRGLEIGTKLKKRRDKLTDMAERYYRYLSDRVDVQCSNQSEKAIVEGFENGDVRVTVAAIQADQTSGTPYYDRRLRKGETKEVRIYLHGGNNMVVTQGKKGRGITVRVIGGPGDDTVDDSKGFGVRFYDSEGNNRIVGNSGSSLNSKPFTMPPPTQPENDTPWVPVQDWGSLKKPLFIVGYHSDPGFTLGGGLDISTYGFRKYPTANRHILKGGFAFGAKKPFIDYKGGFRRENSWFSYVLEGRVSGIDQLRYYGLGNETSRDLDDSNYKISSYQVSLFPGIAISRGDKGGLAFGPILKYSDSTGTKPDTVLAQEQPLGSGKFGEFGVQARGRYDSRGLQTVLQPGIEVDGRGSYFFETWDVQNPFGSIEGNVRGHIRLAEPLLLSLHVAGKKVWGDYPFFEAAYIGGNLLPLGTKWNRWAGDASLGGLAALRWTLKQFTGIVPGQFGVFAMGDVARVFLEGEDSSRWHPSYGGGVFLAPLRRTGIFHIGVGTNPDQGTFFVIRATIAGFAFQ